MMKTVRSLLGYSHVLPALIISLLSVPVLKILT